MIEKVYFEKEEFLIKKDKNVYFPAEDSFLLLKNLKKIRGEVLEVGTGSGIITIYLAKKFSKIKQIYATDKNKYALKNALYNCKINGVKNKIKFIYSDLFKNIPHKKFDFIIFNPPYLPTKKEEKIKTNINLAFDGGKDGFKVIKKFLKQAKNYLKNKGQVYLVSSDLSDLNELKKFLKKENYRYKEISKENFFFERIILYKIKKIRD